MTDPLYIHVPFCDGKCHYCGFYSVLNSTRLIEDYPRLPARELAHLLDTRPAAVRTPIRTLYLGGGTPATLGESGLAELFRRLAEVTPLDSVEESTVELSPASVTPSLLNTLRRLGVNRLSIGVQCFNDAALARIGRRHDAATAIRAIRMAREAGFTNLGIDLIAGLPEVTPEQWLDSLQQVLSLDLQHLSVYALTVEPGTALAYQAEKGLLLPDETAQLADLDQADTLLCRAGFTRYEISNYALPGFACQHNLAVWRGSDYIGLGPSASSRLGRDRWTNERDLEGYTDALGRNASPPRMHETLTALDDATERTLFALRLKEGFDPAERAARFPVLQEHILGWEKKLEALERHGITERAECRWRLTARGREVGDAVIRELL
ncbi:MAG TPA: radical SAM family heme chaperone HemW [Kiritimatiellia bacterium]|nr:radical SAM family heme chaperone HemW [Kiritimatiellia bacterium]HOR97894.1 radical SAM family heme chaperone HemW [Kiritimatiellia bacterium]HPK36838.1 radical SAM family heme chaperone HemW [Kiritimatiellia bacterium]HPW75877.1 radical SAM family heme chaperone HemW [Kiritimatiellia bacterium]HRU20262.1 radical SAM family heme chaperone HemW [Kiritimatiellia bacterium]